jgi:hypothetical protein
MLKRTEPTLTEITQQTQWHTTHSPEKVEALHQRRSAKSGRGLADQIGDEGSSLKQFMVPQHRSAF